MSTCIYSSKRKKALVNEIENVFLKTWKALHDKLTGF